MKDVLLMLFLILLPLSSFGAILNVPNDFDVIQDAVDDAEDGDTVLVHQGWYAEHVVIGGKAITLASLYLTTGDTSHIEETLIDGFEEGNAVTFQDCDDGTCVLSGLTITNPVGDRDYIGGRGIYCVDSELLIERCTITENYSGGGSGLLISGGSEVTVERTVFSRNRTHPEAGGSGGAIRVQHGSRLRLTDSYLADNDAPVGGGVLCLDNSESTIESTVFQGNYATVNCSSGGALYVADNAECRMLNCYITESGSDMYGAAVFHCSSADLLVENCTFERNIYTMGSIQSQTGIQLLNSFFDEGINCVDAHIIDCSLGGNLQLTGECTISHCHIQDAGIRIDGGNTVIDGNSELLNCSVYCFEDSRLKLDKTLLTCNAEGEGSYIRCEDGSELAILNSTVSGNTSERNGVLTCSNRSAATIVNSIFWNDEVPEIAAYSYRDDSITVTVAYSDIQGGFGGVEFPEDLNNEINWLEGNIDSDPLFSGMDSLDFRLSENSPCIDAGIALYFTNDEILVDIPEEDYRGEAPDMGTFEFGLSNVKKGISQPEYFQLLNCYPNPFNSTTTISYSLPFASQVSLKVFDLSGREMMSLVEGCIDAGNHSVSMSGDGMVSGVYLVRMEAMDREQVRKVLLVR